MNRRRFIQTSAAIAAASVISGKSLAGAAPSADSFQHRFAQVNGIRMHYVEAGTGPLVILLHGFPLFWYSWRKQIPALAAAGYRVVVPDQRGYGQTEAPASVRAYNIMELVADITALVGALGEREAVVVGWDWGGEIAWNCALLRPDLFRAVATISRPFAQRTPIRPSLLWKKLFTDKVFYQDYYQAPGVADQEMNADPTRLLRCSLYMLSANAPPEDRWSFAMAPNATVTDGLRAPKELPAWLSEADVKYYGAEFARNGFTPPLNWYRNIDFDWEITPFLDGAKIRQPAMTLAGVDDPAIKWGRAAFDQMDMTVPNLRKKFLIPNAAHLAPEEQPDIVNANLVEFLHSL